MKALLFLCFAIVIQAGDPVGQPVIRRDTYGVPHILAGSEETAALAHGYATAEDHAAVMARAFLRAQGRQAEFLGERFVEDDYRVHQLRIPEIAAERFNQLSSLMQRVLNAYADGYNRYIREHTAELPSYAKPVTGVDILAHCRSVLLLSFALDLRGFNVPQAAAAERGSNMWAIGRKRSATGAGLLLINPHLSWSSPYLLHEAHITVPGRLNVMGAAIVGSPVIGMGYNEHLGWTHTVIPEKFDEVMTASTDELDLETRSIVIKVLTESGRETRTRQVEYSRYGPVIRRQGDKALIFRSINLELVEFLDQWYEMGRSRSLESFRAALERQAIAGFNVGYADRRGNAYYLYNPRIPQRSGPQDLRWGTILSLAALPQLLNPSSGYVQNCNGPPWFTSARDAIDSLKYPAIVSRTPPDLRTQLSVQLLESRSKVTLQDLIKLSRNDRLLLADRVKPGLVASVARSADAQKLTSEAEVLRTWDGRAASSSRGAALFALWWDEYSKAARRIFEREWDPRRPMETPVGIGDPAEAVSALHRAAKRAREAYGSVDVAWGEVHRFRQEGVDLSVSGASAALGAFRVLGFRRDTDGRNRAVFGDSYLAAVEFRGRPRAFSIMAYSQSSNPRSKHYSNQASLFVRGELKPAFFDERELAGNIERSYSPPSQTAATRSRR